MTPAISKSSLLILIIVAIILFVPLFTFRSIGGFDFWWWMSANLVAVVVISFILDKKYISYLREDFTDSAGKKVLLGIGSAVALYLLFFAGNLLSRQWFGFAGEGIEKVYGFKGDAPALRIGLLMLLIIGPGEEIFWRGMLQRHLQDYFGRRSGFIAAALIYTFVHVFTGNLMLITAALVAGIFWGWMFMRFRSMLMNVISHTVWDIGVFLLLPFTS